MFKITILKTLINIEKETWAQVKYFATLKDISVNHAVDFILQSALSNSRQFPKEKIRST